MFFIIPQSSGVGNLEAAHRKQVHIVALVLTDMVYYNYAAQSTKYY
ncbi:MAG: hypothetical protein OXI63_23205 [Candidatus Poribacteria bacterium]|nr:hypothetical protein [Candidatus Poribacteria bacterium]